MSQRKLFNVYMLPILIPILVIALILVLSTCSKVDSGHTGIRVTMGSVSSTVLEEGLHFKMPIVQKIIQMDNRVQKTEVDCGSASKDLQTINSVIAVNVRLDKSFTSEIYKNVGMDYNVKIIHPAIQETVKAVTAMHTAEELITKRQDASSSMKSLLAEKVSEYGIIIDNFNIIDFEFSEEFDRAIEAKQTAQQMALKAQQDLVRVEVEAQQKVAQAKAEAESLKLQKQEITPELLQLRQIEVLKEKWNGKLPDTVYIGGNNDNTLLGIPIK